jgi:HTH-type transcriptional regulator/antitoxin HigA
MKKEKTRLALNIMSWSIIKTEKDYLKASERLEKIFDSKKGDSTFDEAELLVMLLENYETETEAEFPEPDPIEILKFKMEQKNLRNKDLAVIIGGKSKVSEILNKKRRLTLSMIRKINRDLGIPAETLIQEYELAN